MAVAGRKGLSFVVAGVLIIGIGAFFWLWNRSPAVSEREYATRLLGEYLKMAVKPKTVLVVGNPFVEGPGRSGEVYEFDRAGIAGVRAAFGEEAVKVAYPKVKPEVLANPLSVQIDTTSPTPLSFVVESSAFDAVINSSQCDAVVSLIGLPVNLAAMESWTRVGVPRFGLLLPDWRVIGDAAGIRRAFASGKLVCAVIANPRGAGAKELKDRYFLVDSNNIADSLATFPQSFGLR